MYDTRVVDEHVYATVFVHDHLHHVAYGVGIGHVGLDERSVELLGGVGTSLIVYLGDDPRAPALRRTREIASPRIWRPPVFHPSVVTFRTACIRRRRQGRSRS